MLNKYCNLVLNIYQGNGYKYDGPFDKLNDQSGEFILNNDEKNNVSYLQEFDTVQSGLIYSEYIIYQLKNQRNFTLVPHTIP